MTDRRYEVLFLCTGNSARSILAECALNRWGAPRFRAHSAGSHPKSEPHPLTLETLQTLDYDTSGLRSKSWDEFAAPSAPPLDFVFSVCDNARGEACPAWPGQPMTGSWWEVPQALYSPIEQQAVLLQDTSAARAFLAFVRGREALEVIVAYGYGTI